MQVNEFSKRFGFEDKQSIQDNYIDERLRNKLWNLVDTQLNQKFSKGYKDEEYWDVFLKGYFCDFKGERLKYNPQQKEYYYSYDNDFLSFQTDFFSLEWYKVYDFFEFILNKKFSRHNFSNVIDELNNILKQENSAFRVCKKRFIPITNETEIETINDAIEESSNLTALQGINIHLSKSIDLLSDKENPDYANSIKESITALVALCRIITKESTLKKSLDKLEKNGIEFNPQFKEALLKFYAYTNNKKDGIRHEIVDKPGGPKLEDARFMLITCSAFINYLIEKARKGGIDFNTQV